jgi:hypothetical protein
LLSPSISILPGVVDNDFGHDVAVKSKSGGCAAGLYSCREQSALVRVAFIVKGQAGFDAVPFLAQTSCSSSVVAIA